MEMEKQINSWLDQNIDAMVQDLIDVVNIRSVSEPGVGKYPYGDGCKQVLDKTLEIAERLGFPSYNHEEYCGSSLIPGEIADELGLFGHMDVVPEGTGWKYEPYNAVVEDGRVFGRGSFDDKGPTIASMYVMKFLNDNGIKLKHSVRLFYGLSEEKGMDDIRYYLKHNPMPKFALVPDVNFPVCTGEKGILDIDMMHKAGSKLLDFKAADVSNMVPPYAHVVVAADPDAVRKAIAGQMDDTFIIEADGANTKIIAGGVAGHAAWPQSAQSALLKLLKTLDGSGLLDEDGAACVSFLAKALNDFYGAGINTDFSDEYGRLTHVGGMISISDGVLIQNVNIRYPVKIDQDDMVANIRSCCEAAGFTMRVNKNDPPFYIPPESPVIKMLMDTVNQTLNKDYKPYVMGFTYARRLDNAVAYGPGIPERIMPAHQPDESMYIEDLRSAVIIYAKVLLELDKML